jgi:hypothetical protein
LILGRRRRRAPGEPAPDTPQSTRNEDEI